MRLIVQDRFTSGFVLRRRSAAPLLRSAVFLPHFITTHTLNTHTPNESEANGRRTSAEDGRKTVRKMRV